MNEPERAINLTGFAGRLMLADNKRRTHQSLRAAIDGTGWGHLPKIQLHRMYSLLAQSLTENILPQGGEHLMVSLFKVAVVPALALLGVWWTLRAHDKRLRTEQLERRAKDIQRELQQTYGEFGAAALDVVHVGEALNEAEWDEYMIESGQFEMQGMSASEIDKTAKELPSKREALWTKRKDAISKLNLEYSRLYLLEDDSDRLAKVDKFYADVKSFRFRKHEEDFDDDLEIMQKSLTQFMSSMGNGLEQSYRAALELAGKGKSPVRKIIVPKQN